MILTCFDLIAQIVIIFVLFLLLYNLDCFDIYYSYKSDKVHIIDINPLTSSSSTCLFTFSELMEHAQTYLSTSTLFKCIENNDDTIIKNLDRNFLPIDLLNANLDVSTIDFNNLS